MIQATRLLLCILASVLPGVTLAAGTVLKWREDGIRRGEAFHSTYSAFASERGLRIDVVETMKSTTEMTFLYRRGEGTVYFMLPAQNQRIAINDQTIRALKERLRQAGVSDILNKPTAAATHSRHSLNGFTCDGYMLRLKRTGTRLLCSAEPLTLGIPEDVHADFKALGSLIMPFFTYLSRLSPERDRSDDDAVNVFALTGGFPVRMWEPSKDAMASQFELLSVNPRDTPAQLFELPPK